MILASKISELENRFFNISELQGLCLKYYLDGSFSSGEDVESILSTYTGNLEKSAVYGYLGIELDHLNFDGIFKQISNITIKKSLSIFHIIGICILFKSQNDFRYQAILKDWFENHSVRIKFLISRFFRGEYHDLFKASLRKQENENKEIIILKKTYCKDFIENIEYENNASFDDVIHLMILQEYKQKQKTIYEDKKEQLWQSVFFATRDIQSKHKVYNNNEDQFNSVLHSMLSMNYIVENQSQRGLSSSEKTFGELDIGVFTKENKYPLAIIEAYRISSIDKSYISRHLRKLTVNYDPNGLSRNYAVVYVSANNFQETWIRYLEFLKEFEYPEKIEVITITDDTSNHPNFTNIRIGIVILQNNSMPIEVYHIFLNMKNKGT
ncbi:hypothetical protein GCM10009430_44890 [Aquimarina litoralis]|uniref:Uncharacterized protein n=1 Tax=Aquimarina litoralis TaxID=584605 RepID=A0ABN1J8F6_9FLAO